VPRTTFGPSPREPSVKFGLQISSFTWRDGPSAIGPTLARIVRTADDVGFDSIWVMDHFFQIRGVGPPEAPMLEGHTALGFMAAHSQRARLGLMVGGIHYRQPAAWIKAATTLDVLSGGRLPERIPAFGHSRVSFGEPAERRASSANVSPVGCIIRILPGGAATTNPVRSVNCVRNERRRTFLSTRARAPRATAAPFIPSFLLPNHALLQSLECSVASDSRASPLLTQAVW